MGGDVEILKAKLRDCRAECAKLFEEKKMLAGVVSTLQNEVFQMRAEARKAGSDGNAAGESV